MIYYYFPIIDYNVSDNQDDIKYIGRQRKKELNTSEFYDLDNADALYKEYMARYNKTEYKKKTPYTIHFYRFVKTLAERNKNTFQGIPNKPLDETADMIKEPNQYFFG